MVDAISVEVQWDKRVYSYRLFTVVSVNPFQAMRERGEGEEQLLLHRTVTGWATQQEVLGYGIGTESMTIALPERKADDLRQRVAEWPPERETATMKQVLVLAGKLYHAFYVCLLYTSPSPRDGLLSRMPSSA